jgi:peptidyl-tRNA hydrolase, PTH1 family
MADSRFLLVGLGNPGREYESTRHNIGFFYIDHFANLQSLRIDTLKMQGLHCQVRTLGSQLFLVKPQTYMNRSGECVRSYLEYYKIPVCNLLVLHDDLDLPLGKIKIVSQGGSGGHNGIRSIVQHLGTQNFARMKIGIGRPIANDQGVGQPVDQFVLSRMNSSEFEVFDQRKALVEKAVGTFVREGIAVCMNQINGR